MLYLRNILSIFNILVLTFLVSCSGGSSSKIGSSRSSNSNLDNNKKIVFKDCDPSIKDSTHEDACVFVTKWLVASEEDEATKLAFLTFLDFMIEFGEIDQNEIDGMSVEYLFSELSSEMFWDSPLMHLSLPFDFRNDYYDTPYWDNTLHLGGEYDVVVDWGDGDYHCIKNLDGLGTPLKITECDSAGEPLIPKDVSEWDNYRKIADSSHPLVLLNGDYDIGDEVSFMKKYNDPGIKTVKIAGLYSHFIPYYGIFHNYETNSYHNRNLVSVEDFGHTKWKTMDWMFTGSVYYEHLSPYFFYPSTAPNLSEANSMVGTFVGFTGGLTLDLSKWDVSNI